MFLIIVFTILSLDQLTKAAAVSNLIPGSSLDVVKGVFALTLIFNRGAAFGLLKDQAYIFVFISLAAVLLISRALKDKKTTGLYRLSLVLILSGALGNLIDRLRLGYVIDFLDFHIWPVFNLADSAITIGALLLGWLAVKPKRQDAS
jgi:signal peptidase II